jgi:hypothetical protein
MKSIFSSREGFSALPTTPPAGEEENVDLSRQKDVEVEIPFHHHTSTRVETLRIAESQ